MPPKKNMSKPGGKVTNSIFSGPRRRLGDGKEILKSNKRTNSEDSDDGYNDTQEVGEVAKGKKRKIEDSDDDDDYRDGEVREKHDLSHEATKLFPKTQTRSGLRRGFYKYGEGRVLAELGTSDSGREQRLDPTPLEEEGKVTGSKEFIIESKSAKSQELDVGGSTENST